MTEQREIRPVLTGPRVPEWVKRATGDTLVELLDLAVARTPDACALVMRDGESVERWSFAELRAHSEAIARRLRHEGVAPGDRILTWSANDSWLVAAYFGVWRLGAAIVPLDMRMTPSVAEAIGRSVEGKLLLAGPAITDEEIAAIGIPHLRVDAGLAASAETASANAASKPSSLATAESLCEILFTSGTTRAPKGVMLTHGQLLHNVRAIFEPSGGLQREHALAIIPLSHMYGQMVPLLCAIASGSQTTYLSNPTPNRIVSTLHDDQITAITVVPQLLELLMKRIEGEAKRKGRLEQMLRLRAIALRLPFPIRRILFRQVLDGLGGHLRILTSGGARLEPELQMAWEAMGIRVVQGYGATEYAAICSHSMTSRRVGTVGLPLAEAELAFAEDGELLVRGPAMMTGYWNRPEETAEVLAGGWVHTGDALQVDGRGELIYLGRTRDRIALPNGMKVYPEDLEHALQQPGVKASVALEASPGILAAVILPDGPETSDAEIDAAIRAANAALAPHQRIRTWRRWPEPDLPRTHTLKIRRSAVAERFPELPAKETTEA